MLKKITNVFISCIKIFIVAVEGTLWAYWNEAITTGAITIVCALILGGLGYNPLWSPLLIYAIVCAAGFKHELEEKKKLDSEKHP